MKNLLPAALLLVALSAQADSYRLPHDAVFEDECTSCHIAFPPQMLHADSWRAMMGDLSHHFGTDASLDQKRRIAITDLLVGNSGGRKTGATRDASGRPLLRITETTHFVKEHREIAVATFERDAIKSPANCAACHRQAAAGNYSERMIDIPK